MFVPGRCPRFAPWTRHGTKSSACPTCCMLPQTRFVPLLGRWLEREGSAGPPRERMRPHAAPHSQCCRGMRLQERQAISDIGQLQGLLAVAQRAALRSSQAHDGGGPFADEAASALRGKNTLCAGAVVTRRPTAPPPPHTHTLRSRPLPSCPISPVGQRRFAACARNLQRRTLACAPSSPRTTPCKGSWRQQRPA